MKCYNNIKKSFYLYIIFDETCQNQALHKSSFNKINFKIKFFQANLYLVLNYFENETNLSLTYFKNQIKFKNSFQNSFNHVKF